MMQIRPIISFRTSASSSCVPQTWLGFYIFQPDDLSILRFPDQMIRWSYSLIQIIFESNNLQDTKYFPEVSRPDNTEAQEQPMNEDYNLGCPMFGESQVGPKSARY